MLRSRFLVSVPCALVFGIAVMLCGCGDEKSPPPGPGGDSPTGTLVAVSDCGGFGLTANYEAVSPDQSCIEYSYDDDGVFHITHRNAGFNCCPEISSQITVDDGVITIVEVESLENGGCDCLCLFDLEFEITDLTPGEYEIRVVEPYWPNDPGKLIFTVDLNSQPSGTFCVQRDVYPWGIVEGPVGWLTATSDCGGFQLMAEYEAISPDQSCIEYSFGDDGVFRMTHRNAGFNCCPELSSQIAVDNGVITIVEIESLEEGGCHCLCLFDLEFEVFGLAPGEYEINIVEPYWQGDAGKLEFTVDLVGQPTGAFCVYRDVYPWGLMVD